MKKVSSLPHFFYFLVILSLVFPVHVIAADDEEGDIEAEAIYYELAPPFVVNLQDPGKRIRFLQVRIQVLAYGQDKIDKVKTHDPVVRDALITLLSGQSRKDINTSKKKKALQEKALNVVKKILKEETGRSQIESLYFTSFVVQ